jgi:hypothetical protein
MTRHLIGHLINLALGFLVAPLGATAQAPRKSLGSGSSTSLLP